MLKLSRHTLAHAAACECIHPQSTFFEVIDPSNRKTENLVGFKSAFYFGVVRN